MSDKELYGVILKYYNVFSPYILKRRDDRIMNSSNRKDPGVFTPPILRVEADGIGIISALYPSSLLKTYGYISFSIFSTPVAYEMQKYVKLYKIDNCCTCSGFICHSSNQDILFRKFASDIYNIDAPPASIDSSLIDLYIKANNNVLDVDCFRSMLCYRELKEHTIWGYNRLYTSIFWTFDLVEKYKEQINWKKLIELSNLKWDISTLTKYGHYIPLIVEGKEFYADRFNSKITVDNFSQFIINDSSYIIDNVENIAIVDFLRTATYTLNPGDIMRLYQKMANVSGYLRDEYYKDYLRKASDYLQSNFYFALVNNKNIKWTPDLLFELYQECKKFLNLDKDSRLSLIPIFEEAFDKYPDLNEVLDGTLFLAKMKEGAQKNNAYSIFFTPENILSNLSDWNEVIVDGAFSHTHRLSRDHYFYVYNVKTMWNYFNENEDLCLNYEICKVLSEISITIGGSYEKEYDNQDYYDVGFHSKSLNALEYFSNHKFSNDEEIEKLICDEELMGIMLNYNNETIIEYCLNVFFRDYSVDKFLDVVRHLGLV